MDNIDKSIAQGYADFADDGDVSIEANESTSLNLYDTLEFPEMSELNKKLRACFDGRIVRKDLTKSIKEAANVPVYVLEFLLGQYCSIFKGYINPCSHPLKKLYTPYLFRKILQFAITSYDKFNCTYLSLC